MAQQLPFILRDTQTGREYPISPKGLRIGRISKNDVVLADEKVSRYHATLWVRDDQLYVRDENSTNGTWVNDECITGPKVLEAGDRVRIGNTVFEITAGAGLPPAAAVVAPAQATLPIIPIAIASGIVLVILIALLMRAIGGASVPPTIMPTLTLALTSTATVAPTDTLMRQPSPIPTRTPAPIPTPVPQATQPELTAPAQGMEYSNPVTFRWIGSLGAGQAYQVTAYHPGSDHTIQSELLMTQEWTTDLPAERFGEWRWRVSVVQGGKMVTTSYEWMFWFNPFPGTKQPPPKTPQPTETPGRSAAAHIGLCVLRVIRRPVSEGLLSPAPRRAHWATQPGYC